MDEHLRDFWRRLQTGVEVAVAGQTPDRLLGVRDGFVRYFHRALERHISVAVVPHPIDEVPAGLAASTEEVLERARSEAHELRDRLTTGYHFYVASEGGIETVQIGEQPHSFVRNWTLVLGSVGEAWGGSGAVQLPDLLLTTLGDGAPALPVPGTRRRGGIISSLTGGQETRRMAVAQSTFNALSTLFYGILQSRPLSAQ